MEKLIAAWNWLVALVLGLFKKAPTTPAAPGVPDVGDSLKSKIAEGEKEAAQQKSEAKAVAASQISELKAVSAVSDDAERRKRLADLANKS